MHRDDNKLDAMLERVLRMMQASQQSGWLTIPEAAAYMKSTVWYVRRVPPRKNSLRCRWKQIHLESNRLRCPHAER